MGQIEIVFLFLKRNNNKHKRKMYEEFFFRYSILKKFNNNVREEE